MLKVKVRREHGAGMERGGRLPEVESAAARVLPATERRTMPPMETGDDRACRTSSRPARGGAAFSGRGLLPALLLLPCLIWITFFFLASARI